MAKSNISANKKKDEILSAALKLFLEKGFDGTSIRGIMKEAGGEIGLFYYYFKNKDDIYDQVLECILSNYNEHFSSIAEESLRDPYRTLNNFFTFLWDASSEFFSNSAQKINKTVLWALRDRILVLAVPHINRILTAMHNVKEIYDSDINSLSELITYGIGGRILHRDANTEGLNLSDCLAELYQMLYGVYSDECCSQDIHVPYFADISDISDIISMLNNFDPGNIECDTEEFSKLLQQYVNDKEIIIVRDNGQIAGYVLFSRYERRILMLAVKKKYQITQVAKKLLVCAMAEYPENTELSLIAFRRDLAHTNNVDDLFNEIGFKEQQLIDMNGCLCRTMTAITGKVVK